MLRFLISTAAVLALSLPAMAEMKLATDPAQTATADTAEVLQEQTKEAAATMKDMAGTFDPARIVAVEGWKQSDRVWTARELTGLPLYDANNTWVGEIDNIVISADGTVQGAVLGVGGFLGVGEKDVLVSFDSLVFFEDEAGGDIRAYADVTREGLEALPDYGS